MVIFLVISLHLVVYKRFGNVKCNWTSMLTEIKIMTEKNLVNLDICYVVEYRTARLADSWRCLEWQHDLGNIIFSTVLLRLLSRTDEARILLVTEISLPGLVRVIIFNILQWEEVQCPYLNMVFTRCEYLTIAVNRSFFIKIVEILPLPNEFLDLTAFIAAIL